MIARRRPLRLVTGLAAAHLWHEWILTLCLMIALAAVIAPLLVLLGLKHGTIETLRERLVEDPLFREIRPAQTREYPREWFAEVSQWPGVAFMTPTILPLSSVLSIVHPGSGRVELFDLVPSGPGDPLLLENGGVIPADGEIVLSLDAAERLGVVPGDDIGVRITRSRAGRSEVVEPRLKVVAVLSPRAGTLPRVYAPLPFVADVEAYKEGYAAPARAWPGDTPEPYLSFDGAVVLLPDPLPPITRTGLIINTGFGQMGNLSPAQVEALLGFMPPAGFSAYDIHTPGGTVTPSSLRAVRQKLRGFTHVVMPYVRGVRLQAADGTTLNPMGVSLNAEQARLLALPVTPWGALDARRDDAGRLLGMLWPEGRPMVASLEVLSQGMSESRFPLTTIGTSPLDRPVVPVELLGMLRTATQRAVNFLPESGRFEMARGGYRGFRLYAASIDDVPTLSAQFSTAGIETIAEVAAIERIQVLDRGLTRLFWLISVLSIAGGTAVLIASLYAAVERRQRDLGVMRLLGLTRGHVFFFPVAEGAMIAALGLTAGFAGYAALAAVINRAFASELAPGEVFCTLPLRYLPVAVATILVLAALASLAAAWRATRIDPAEAIRDQ